MRTFVGYRPNPPAEYIERGTAAPVDEPQYEGVIFTDGSQRGMKVTVDVVPV